MCLYFGCGGVGCVGGWRIGPGSWRVGWWYVCVSGLSVLMAGPGICILCYADACAS